MDAKRKAMTLKIVTLLVGLGLGAGLNEVRGAGTRVV